MKQTYLIIILLIFTACDNGKQEIENSLKNKIDSLSIELEKVASELKRMHPTKCDLLY